MSPVPPIAHLIAIALGVFGGLWLGGVISPDLPSAETEPGVVAEDAVAGSDPESLFHADPLQEAVTQTIDQLGAGAEVSVVLIEPDSLEASPYEDVNTLPLDAMPLEAPERMLGGIRRARAEAGVEEAVDLDDVRRFSWAPANPTATEWSVLLDESTVGPPTRFVASRDGSRVRVR